MPPSLSTDASTSSTTTLPPHVSGWSASILLVSLITSKGAHGIPGSALVILAATLTAIPAIPVVGLVLVLAVDWFMGIGRALTNLIGNCVATVAIARWEKDIDIQRANKVLSGQMGYTFQPKKPVAPAHQQEF